MPSRGSEHEAERQKILAEDAAERQQILADYELCVEYRAELERLAEAQAGGAPVGWYWADQVWPTDEEFAAKRDERLDQADVRLERKLKLLELKYPLVEPELANEARTLPAWNDPPGMKKQPGPRPGLHERETILVALTWISAGVEAAMTASGLHKKDVLRVERMSQLGLLELEDDASLWVDPHRVQQYDKKIALRVLSPDGPPRWLDPREVPVRAHGAG